MSNFEYAMLGFCVGCVLVSMLWHFCDRAVFFLLRKQSEFINELVSELKAKGENKP